MAGEVQNIKVCSSLKQHSGLTGKYHEISRYSYNLSLYLMVGKKFPKFSFKDLNGNEYNNENPYKS